MKITERLAWLAATCFGLGKIPWAPGTWGSGVGIFLAWATAGWPLGGKGALLAGLTLIGVWASGRVARRLTEEDPSCVILDEVAGAYLAALAFHSGLELLGAFLLFRLLDIFKPWPLKLFERLPGGWGIMADDLAAGALALLLRLVLARG
ncbi:phosphatidylglycerophosphatase A [Thermosulfurimonas marina]|uniref:Phosphatidylglycerophosphatase A n=1 Tax=Thermosulfurimonas marina TaxID=2047767 RepID=A0A6H1WS52_9BACT|nr:phosphatidylglycerophosphatase A [Thermosulfurimonas marina]QJA05984.1 phosphatidylglycerophosphatase A [Thermosulfurimonas marina]